MKTNFAQKVTLAVTFTLAAAGVLSRPLTALAQQAQTVQAAQPSAQTPAPVRQEASLPPGLSIGAWQVPPPLFSFDTDTAKEPAKKGFINKIKKGVNVATDATMQGVHGIVDKAGKNSYLHFYLNVKDEKGQEYEIHAFPVDEITGKLRNFNDVKNARLRVVILTKAEAHDVYLELDSGWKEHNLLKLPPEQPENLINQPTGQNLGRIEDFAQAVNKANLPFEAATADASLNTLNDTAFMVSALSTVGVCLAGSCPALTTLYSGYRTPGINNGLAGRITVAPVFETVGTVAPPSKLISIFQKTKGNTLEPSAARPETTPASTPPVTTAPQLPK